jgi:hypothetical protein
MNTTTTDHRWIRLLSVLVVITAACTPTGESDVTVAATPAPTTAESAVPPARASDGTLWGFTPLPTEISIEGLLEAYDIIEDHADLVAHHFDECVPWTALVEGGPLPRELDEQLQLRAARTRDDWAVFVAISLLAITRDGPARDCDPAGRAPEDFDDPDVLSAARVWVDLLVERLDPDFINVGVEVNLYGAFRPDDVDALIAVTRALYDHVQAEHPGIPVMASYQIDFTDGPVSPADLAVGADMLGLSSYPEVAGFTGLPADDRLDAFAALGIPIAFAETGWRGDLDPDVQADYVAWLGRMAERHEMPFVVWFAPGDPDPLAAGAPPELRAIAELFDGIGLIAADGTERPALAVWDAVREG